MPRYRLLAIDIDGTLVDLSDEITHHTRAALSRAGQAGIDIVLATGRRYARALPIVQSLGIDLPLVTASGALIKHPANHQTLFRADLSRATLLKVLAIVEQSGYEALLYTDSYGEGFDFYCARLDVESPELLEFYDRNAGCARLWPELTSNPPDDIFGGFVMGTREQMLELEAKLQQAVPGQLYTHVLRSPKYTGFMCEIAPSGVTKWSGILQLAGSWGIRAEEICAVGDDVNDIPMIQGAGLGIAMGNALPEVKAAADRIAPRHDEDGLVTVVDWLLQET